MPVPEHVIFGPSFDLGKEFSYGDVRKLDDPNQFLAIRLRVSSFFNQQVGELGIQDDGMKKVYSPFPLFLLTCVGIETLGRLFFTREPTNSESRDDIQRKGFLAVCTKLHQKGGRPLSKKQKTAYDHIWGEGESDRIESISNLIYKFGRHTMMHGYQGRGVFLTEKDIDGFDVVDGSLHLNPYGFWQLYLQAYDKLWEDFLKFSADNHPQEISMRLYCKSLLN